ncbi:MAG: sugar phosphate isomerase/epimerase family protein [Bacillota bacterium]
MKKIIWGYACPAYWELTRMDENPLYAKLKLMEHFGFSTAGQSIGGIADMNDADRENLWQYLADHSLTLCPEIGYDYVHATADEIKRKTEEIAGMLGKFGPLMKGAIVTTGPRAGHRFDREMPLSEKMERLSKALAPLAAFCKGLGTPLGIENHGDYYCSDLVELCRQTPDLYIFLDTGNVYLVGERPMPAYEAAAPYTIGTHFKDHFVHPDPQQLHFVVEGSPLGEGDVPLRECYDLLMKHAPFNTIVMQMEMISPKGMNPMECLKKSVDFIRTLGGRS